MMSEKILNLNSTSPTVRLMQSTIVNWRRWRTNANSRRQLAKLTCGQLRDIGLSCGEAVNEANKPFWYNNH
jgi:uncharacterized protein YjiS (DUF1127 family)